MENLNDAEFGSNKDGEEAPILVAQRYLNIFRQVHIFNKAKRDQFDDELLALPTNISDFFKKMPGGRLLVEHIEEVKTERGISFVKSNKEDFTGGYGEVSSAEGGAPQVVAGGPVVGGNLVLGESFAETFSKSMAEAFKQLPTPVAGAPISGGNVSVDLGNAFDVLAEEIRTSRASLLDVLKETRSITDSVIASQVSISRILEGILSARSRDENDVANLNNKIIASQASISKLLESLYTGNTSKVNVSNTSNIDLEYRLQEFKREIKQEIDSSLNKIQEMIKSANFVQQDASNFNVSNDEPIDVEENNIINNENTSKKKKKKKKKNREMSDVLLTSATIATPEALADDAVYDINSSFFEDNTVKIDGTIRNEAYKYNDSFNNVNLNEPPYEEDLSSGNDETVDDLDFTLPEQSTETDISADETPLPDIAEGLESFDDDDLDFELPEHGIAIDTESRKENSDVVDEDIISLDDNDLDFAFSDNSPVSDNEFRQDNLIEDSNAINDADEEITSSLNSDSLYDNENMDDLSFNDLISDLSINNSDTKKADEDWESELTSNAGVEETEDFNSINSLDDMPFEDNSLDSFADTDFEQSASNDVDNGNLDNFSDNLQQITDATDESTFEESGETFDTNINETDTNSLDNISFEDNSLDSLADIDFEQSTFDDVDNDNLDNFADNLQQITDATDESTFEESSDTFDTNINETDTNSLDNISFEDNSLDDLTNIDFEQSNSNNVDSVNLDNFVAEDAPIEENFETFSDETENVNIENENTIISVEDNSLSDINEISSSSNAYQSRYSAELDKIREALTSDNIDLSSLDEPIALDEYSDDENIMEENTSSSNEAEEWEYEYVEDEGVASEQPIEEEQHNNSTSEEEGEWEYVDEEGNPITPSDNEEWEWEYVDEEGNPITSSDNEEWEWEYVDETEEADNKEQ